MARKKKLPKCGLWKVTTEGDCEGKTTKELGIFKGYIDEIAFALADQCTHTLWFTAINPKDINLTPRKDIVRIGLSTACSYDLGTFKTNAHIMDFIKSLCKNPETKVVNTHGGLTATITTHEETIAEKKEKALAKLTDEEKQLLNLS